MNAENVTYFNSFGVAHIPNEIRKFIGNRNIITIISSRQAYDSIRCRYICIQLIGFMLKVKSLLDYTFSFSFLKNMKRMKKQ